MTTKLHAGTYLINQSYEDRTWLDLFIMNWQIHQGIVFPVLLPVDKEKGHSNKEMMIANFISAAS